MNIFKILSRGGKIKEPAISAFLAYLLDPKGDHGLNSKFLEAFLFPLLRNHTESLSPKIGKYGKEANGTAFCFEKDGKFLTVNDLSVFSEYEVSVYLEKELNLREIDESDSEKGEHKEKNQIIDIVLKISKIPPKQRQALSIFKDNEPLALIFIENKINYGALTPLQINKQYKAVKAVLEYQVVEEGVAEEISDLKNTYANREEQTIAFYEKNCFFIYVTPDDHKNKFKDELKKAEENAQFKGAHVQWSNKSGLDPHSIESILNNILQLENVGKIDPIQEYTKHTLKGFRNFILADFKTEVEELRDYKDFDDLKQNCTAFKKSKNKEWVQMFHKEIMNFFMTESKYQDFEESELVKYSSRRITYNDPLSDRKIFHIQFEGLKKFQIFYRSDRKFDLINVQNHKNPEQKKGKPVLERWQFVYEPQTQQDKSIFPVFVGSLNFLQSKKTPHNTDSERIT